MVDVYKNQVGQLAAMAAKHGIDAVCAKLNAISADMGGYRVRVLFVGGFSAGKSALLNAAMGVDLLNEGITPETAIATELVFDTREFAELISENGAQETTIDDAKTRDVSKYLKYVFHVNNNFLREHREFIFVDLPGFASANGGHDLAIAQYASNGGNAYILCADCEEGTIKGSVAEGLREIRHYTNNLACAVTKADKKTAQDVESVRQSVSSTLKSLFGENVKVLASTAWQVDGIPSADSVVAELLETFDALGLFKQQFSVELIDAGQTIVDTLNTLKANSGSDTLEQDREIYAKMREKSSVERLFEGERRKLQSLLRNTVKPAVERDIENALNADIASLVAAAKGGDDALSGIVNRIVRQTLITSLQKHAETEIAQFVCNIDVRADIGAMGAGDDEAEWAAAVESSLVALTTLKMPKKSTSVVSSTVVPMGIAAALLIIDPILGVAVAAIPLISKILGSLFGIGNKGSDVEKQLRDKVFPQILNQLSPQLDKAVGDIENDVITRLQDSFAEKMAAAGDALSAAQAKKRESEERYAELINGLDGDIAKVRDIIEEVRHA